jgi:HD-like signal output (HDOD) protein/prolyl-tRNA editing enzyme YbaK/EbsC (Cys-tRNA(Pro) deacylase)
MALPEITLNTLSAGEVSYEVISSDSNDTFLTAARECRIPMEQLARTLTISAQGRVMLLVLRAADLLDFSMLTSMFGDQIELKSYSQTQPKGCEPDTRPPISAMSTIDVVLDEALSKEPYIYFDSGARWDFVKVTGRDFCKLNQTAVIGRFSCPPEKLYNIDHPEDGKESKLLSFTPKRIHQRVEETLDLPAMPTIAQEVMRLRVDPKAGAAELAAVVEQDPSLSAQVISWASSPYYGYQGKIDSIHTAISRVLGFDLVLNLALGISVGKAFNVSNDGPLGLKSYWKQSVYCATLSEKLCSFVRNKTRPARGLVYLSGLLHNFGQLLLGHLFPPQFYLINRYVSMNPHIPLVDIERYLLGTSHVEIGEWLMKSWNMPEELVTAVRWHHHEDVWRDHAVYSNLVLISNRLLKRIDIGDATQIVLPEAILDTLGIEEEDAFRALDLIVADERELDSIAHQMVA